MSPREAEVTDPQQRVFLEAAWEALERAGYDPETYDGSIGVYAGMSNNSYFLANLHHRPDVLRNAGELAMLGNEKDYLATRVSYKLNLRGPSINVVTACSSSLVAVCQAVQASRPTNATWRSPAGFRSACRSGAGTSTRTDSSLPPTGTAGHSIERAAGTVFSQRPRHRGAQTARRGAGGRGHDLRRDQGRSREQRRFGQRSASPRRV